MEKETKNSGKINPGDYEGFVKPDLIEFFEKVWIKKENWVANYLSKGANEEDIKMLNNLYKYLTTKS